MQEALIALVVIANTVFVGCGLALMFKYFPKISHSQVHRATTKQHMEVSAALMDADGTARMAQEAEETAREQDKPLGVTNDMFAAARELAIEEGCTIDDALLTLQAEAGGFPNAPRGTA